jgi:ABC-type nitrate/sulfonate/bicarbonate transport system substrate-binding protein
MTRCKKSSALLAFSTVLALDLACAEILHAQKLRVAYTAFAGTFTILWLGKDAGLYQKQGIDMELLYIGSVLERSRRC